MPVMLKECTLTLDVVPEYHEKRRKDIYSVRWPGQRLSKEEFQQVADIMKAGGGWYGRAYRTGGVPARFLFLNRKAAEESAARCQMLFADNTPVDLTDDAPF